LGLGGAYGEKISKRSIKVGDANACVTHH